MIERLQEVVCTECGHAMPTTHAQGGLIGGWSVHELHRIAVDLRALGAIRDHATQHRAGIRIEAANRRVAACSDGLGEAARWACDKAVQKGETRMKQRPVKITIMQPGVPATQNLVYVTKRTREIRIQLDPAAPIRLGAAVTAN